MMNATVDEAPAWQFEGFGYRDPETPTVRRLFSVLVPQQVAGFLVASETDICSQCRAMQAVNVSYNYHQNAQLPNPRRTLLYYEMKNIASNPQICASRLDHRSS